MERFGVADGATPQKSGKFVVRVPKTLHFALEREAAQEGVSLNQLVVAKLAMSLGRTAQKRGA
jgi:antitoxin HicB